MVTGGTGLVGAHSISALLQNGHTVRAFMRDAAKLERVLTPLGVAVGQCEIAKGELGDASALRNALEGCDAVLHTAGLFSNRQEDKALMERTNIDGTRAVLSLASELGLDPIVHVSSILALFPPPGAIQTAADPVRSPSSVYAATKARAEAIAREFQDCGAPVVCVYPGAVQGPHDPTFSDGPQLIARYLKSGSVLVTQGGLVYTDVRDLAKALSCTFEAGHGPRRYMFGGNYVSHEELHELLEKLTGRRLKAQRIPGWLLRWMGRIGEVIAGLRGKTSPLTYEAASVLTTSVPSDDSAALREFQLETVDAETSFRDLLLWMHETGRLRDEHVGVLAEVPR
nr:NAD-dependent epimerase/dehydratase family protein [Litorivivens lipolytica]